MTGVGWRTLSAWPRLHVGDDLVQKPVALRSTAGRCDASLPGRLTISGVGSGAVSQSDLGAEQRVDGWRRTSRAAALGKLAGMGGDRIGRIVAIDEAGAPVSIQSRLSCRRTAAWKLAQCRAGQRGNSPHA